MDAMLQLAYENGSLVRCDYLQVTAPHSLGIEHCRSECGPLGMCRRKAEERRRRRLREQEEDAADRAAEAEEKRQRRLQDGGSASGQPLRPQGRGRQSGHVRRC